MGRSSDILDIEYGVGRVHGSLVLGRLTDQTLLLGEGNERGGGEATLLVGNDLDIAALVGGNARVGGACERSELGMGWRDGDEISNNRERDRRHRCGRQCRRRGQKAAWKQKTRTRRREHTQIDTDRTVVDFFGHLDKRVVRNLDEKFSKEKQRDEERRS
jgi:hypothetical protein